MAIYLEASELKTAYQEAERWTKDWQKPFNEYERIAGNRISKELSKNMPRVNDGSLAASLLETPMQVLPMMQSGKFTPMIRKESWLTEIANIIWKTRIVPNANTQAAFFDKEQIALYRALKYGAQPRYNFFVSNENYTGSDWSLPYIKNLKLEPGKYSVDDCDYVFLDIYFTKLQLKKIIDNQKQETKRINSENKAEEVAAQAEGRTPNLQTADTTWNIKNVQKLVDMAKSSKEIEEQNINEREKNVNAAGAKTTIIFNRGIGANFRMFSKHLADSEYLREWDNPDPTGDLPITMQYCYETLESPYGIGRVELAGPTQNVLDYMTQAHVLATQLGLQPPKKITGSTDNLKLDTIVSAPDAIWQVGNSQVEVVETTSHVYSQFPANYGLYKTQLQTLQGRTDASISAASGNPDFSKTPAGVKVQEARTNTQDNYLRNKADTASAKMTTKMMNVHMAQMQGADILSIAEEDLARLTKAGYFDDNPDTDAPSVKEIKVLYDEIKDTFKFEFDPRPEADDAEKARWIEILDIVSSNPNIIPMLQADGYDLDMGEVFKKIIANSGASDWDKVLVKTSPDQAQGAPTDPNAPVNPNAVSVGSPVTPPSGPPPPTPSTPKPLVSISAKIGDLTAPERAQALAKDGITPSPTGPAPVVPLTGAVPAAPIPGATPTAPMSDIPQHEDPKMIALVRNEYNVDVPTAKFMINASNKGYNEQEIAQLLSDKGIKITIQPATPAPVPALAAPNTNPIGG